MNDEPQIEPAAFFSYARADDEHDGGYLTELRRTLAAEVSAQLGREFLIFQDREDILWGQRWRDRIDESVDSATVLLAVLTPTFMQSSACQQEIDRFLEREQALGHNDLILPIYYIAIPGFSRESNDPRVANLAGRQYVDWRNFRFDALSDPVVRRLVAKLAQQILSSVVLNPVKRLPDYQADIEEVGEEVGHEGGFVELVAVAEEAMPQFGQTIIDFGVELEGLGAITQSFALEVESANLANKPATARLLAMRKLSNDFVAPAERMEELAADYTEQLARVDGGIRALISRVPMLEADDDVNSAVELAKILRNLSEQGGAGIGALDEFRKSLRSVGQMSSTIRPVMHRIENAVSLILPSKDLFAGWVQSLQEALDARTV